MFDTSDAVVATEAWLRAGEADGDAASVMEVGELSCVYSGGTPEPPVTKGQEVSILRDKRSVY